MAHRKPGVCICVKRHSPVCPPKSGEWHHIEPKAYGGSDEDENLVFVCGTTHNNIHVYIRTGKGGNPYSKRLAELGIAAILRNRGYDV